MKKTLAVVALLGMSIHAGLVGAQIELCAVGVSCSNTMGGDRRCVRNNNFSSVTVMSTMTYGPATCFADASGFAGGWEARRSMVPTTVAGCVFTGNFVSGATSDSYTCTIDASDGLPVELLEFGIAGDEADAPDEAG